MKCCAILSKARSRPGRSTPFAPTTSKEVIPGHFLQRAQAEFSAPIMAGAMDLTQSIKRLEELEQTKPILVVGNHPDLIAFAVSFEVPAIILTGYAQGETPDLDFSGFRFGSSPTATPRKPSACCGCRCR